MAMRIRVLAGCFAMGVTALLVTGTAAQATPQSGAHLSAHVSAVSPDTGAGGGWTQSATPTPTPTCTCHYTPPPTPTPSPT